MKNKLSNDDVEFLKEKISEFEQKIVQIDLRVEELEKQIPATKRYIRNLEISLHELENKNFSRYDELASLNSTMFEIKCNIEDNGKIADDTMNADMVVQIELDKKKLSGVDNEVKDIQSTVDKAFAEADEMEQKRKIADNLLYDKQHELDKIKDKKSRLIKEIEKLQKLIK